MDVARVREHATTGARDGAPAPGGDVPSGVREWLSRVPQATGELAAAFDTRLPTLLAGGAAWRIARALEHSGYRLATWPGLATRPVGFQVTATEPVLRAGERDRARASGTDLGALLGGGAIR